MPQIIKKQHNKADQFYQVDIHEVSDLNLYLDELIEVRGISSTSRLHERLFIVYKGGRNRQYPLLNILNEGLNTLIKIFSKMTRGGFTQVAKTEVLRRIKDIRLEC